MTLNELRYIVAVAQERNFGRAAAKCFVSQPALSVAIQKLEDELGAALFERGKARDHGDAGGRAHRRAGAEGAGGDGAHPRNRDGGRDQLVGVLRLGVIYTVAPYLLPDLIPALHAVAPQMPLEIEENLTENLEAALKSGRIDAAIVALPFAPPGIVTNFCTRSRSRSSCRRATSGQSARPWRRTSWRASTRSCSTSAIASATRCSTPAPSSTGPRRR